MPERDTCMYMVIAYVHTQKLDWYQIDFELYGAGPFLSAPQLCYQFYDMILGTEYGVCGMSMSANLEGPLPGWGFSKHLKGRLQSI